MKLSRALPACLILAAVVAVPAGPAQAWSLLDPFGGSSDSKTAKPAPKPAPKPAAKPAKPEPSTLDKIGAGTKSFVTGVGDVVTLKKLRTPTPAAPKAKPAGYASASKPKSKSSGSSWWNPFHREEPKGPKSMSDFVGMERP